MERGFVQGAEVRVVVLERDRVGRLGVLSESKASPDEVQSESRASPEPGVQRSAEQVQSESRRSPDEVSLERFSSESRVSVGASPVGAGTELVHSKTKGVGVQAPDTGPDGWG